MNLPNTVKFIIFAFFISISSFAQTTKDSTKNTFNKDVRLQGILGKSIGASFDSKDRIKWGNTAKIGQKIIDKLPYYYYDKRTGIPIYFSAHKTMFPTSWRNKRVNGKAVSLLRSEYKRSKELITYILEKYPIQVIKNNLTAIYIVDHLEFYGQSYGGTNSNTIVYLTNKGTTNAYSDFYIEQLFHAEFSSVLLRKYSNFLDKKEWASLNHKDFKYGKGGVDALKNKLTGQEFVEKINKQGLLNQYAMSNLENDFNSFAKNIFLPRRNFGNILKKYKNLNKKKILITKFYKKIHKKFNKKFFDDLIYPKEEVIMPATELIKVLSKEEKPVFIDKRSGILVYFHVTAETFPTYWRTSEINPTAVSLPEYEYERVKKVIIKSLKKYPLSVLKKNLKKIYVLKYVEFYGQLYGGTNSTDAIYLSNKGVSMGYTNFYLEQTFHHEFSSIFLRNFPHLLDKKRWLEANADGFKYGKGGVAALKSGKSSQFFDPIINEKGLLSQYSQSSFENDLNNFAQNIFLPHKDFADLLIKYPRINKKKKILVDFYTKIDKGFTKEFFEKIIFPNDRPSDNLALPPRE